METESHLSEFLELDVTYDRASHGKRLGNYIIDIIGFYIVAIALAIFMAFYFPSVLERFDGNDTAFSLLDNLITLVLYGIYMGVLETIFKGRSFGKLITGTRTVNLDGSFISPQTAFLRGFCRAVPFNAFSALGSPSNPWHDKWTNTMVVSNFKKLELG